MPIETRKPRLSAREKAARDDQIVAARMAGRSWRSIAGEFSISERQAMNVMREYRESCPALRDQDPMEVLDSMLDRFSGAQDELAEIAAHSKHDATRVGAIRTSLEAMRAQADLLAAVGVLPRNPGALRAELDTQRVVKLIVAALDRHRVGVEVQRDILAALGGRNGSVTADVETRPR